MKKVRIIILNLKAEHTIIITVQDINLIVHTTVPVNINGNKSSTKSISFLSYHKKNDISKRQYTCIIEVYKECNQLHYQIIRHVRETVYIDRIKQTVL